MSGRLPPAGCEVYRGSAGGGIEQPANELSVVANSEEGLQIEDGVECLECVRTLDLATSRVTGVSSELLQPGSKAKRQTAFCSRRSAGVDVNRPAEKELLASCRQLRANSTPRRDRDAASFALAPTVPSCSSDWAANSESHLRGSLESRTRTNHPSTIPHTKQTTGRRRG
jgi:hypothetical protein